MLEVFPHVEAAEGATTRATARQSIADFIAEYPDIDSEIKYKKASMKAYGYLEKGVREYPELREIVKLHFPPARALTRNTHTHTHTHTRPQMSLYPRPRSDHTTRKELRYI